jgi:hypothetical protein
MGAAEYTGTQIAPNGKRYASGAPQLSENVEEPIIVRARGAMTPGFTLTINSDGEPEWAGAGDGTGGAGGGIDG